MCPLHSSTEGTGGAGARVGMGPGGVAGGSARLSGGIAAAKVPEIDRVNTTRNMTRDRAGAVRTWERRDMFVRVFTSSIRYRDVYLAALPLSYLYFPKYWPPIMSIHVRTGPAILGHNMHNMRVTRRELFPKGADYRKP